MEIIKQREVFDRYEPITQVVAWTFSLFFLPMFLLGTISPQVIRLAVPDVAHAGRVAGRVYAWSTAGAIAGTFAAGYLLLSALGMYQTLLAVALVVTLTSLLAAKVWETNTLLYLFSIVIGAALLFLATFAVFRPSPIHPVFDYADVADEFRERTPLPAAETDAVPGGPDTRRAPAGSPVRRGR